MNPFRTIGQSLKITPGQTFIGLVRRIKYYYPLINTIECDVVFTLDELNVMHRESMDITAWDCVGPLDIVEAIVIGNKIILKFDRQVAELSKVKVCWNENALYSFYGA